MNKSILCAAAAVLIAASNANADEHKSSPISHAPIGVMGDHTHGEDEWMFSYRYSNMYMGDNRIGTNTVTPAQTRAQGFAVAPLDMTMEMHMFGAMYGASDDLTLMAMLPYVLKSMDHETGALARFNTSTEGFGDAKISGLYTIYENNGDSVHLNLGLALPSGSITERGDTPAAANAKLPYPMQLGSGSVDPIFGVTYNSYFDNWAWGAQGITTQRFYRNNEGYRLGDEYNGSVWIGKDLSDYIGVNFRFDGKIWEDISGSDGELTPTLVPTARADLRGGKRVDAVVGVNFYDGGSGIFNGNRLAGEFAMPLYQDLDGPQLETDYRFTLGWQYSF